MNLDESGEIGHNLSAHEAMTLKKSQREQTKPPVSPESSAKEDTAPIPVDEAVEKSFGPKVYTLVELAVLCLLLCNLSCVK